ncbi:unnamed protein product [Allacma fusca]|uniref:Uncharacterized protein n=1 Tax=Allacma fusca TaxID=39272 RepID=A0A8J2LHQ6_9HEXA|nr:unnamed protein product [Allacma fusca]
MSVKYDFSGSRVLVTGGAGALGQSTVLKFLESGATVVVLDKDTTNIHELLQQYPTCLETITVDLTNWEETAKAISQTLPIHHLVNNAGIPGPALPFLQIRPEDVDKVLDINFKAMINVSQAVAAGMIEGNFGGTIVNISSVVIFSIVSSYIF